MFRLSMSMGLVQQAEQSLAQRLEHRQRLEQRYSAQILAMRVNILSALYPEGEFHPEGSCPSCGHKMSHEEILVGFSDDPHDTTTKCPKCSKRFQPRLASQSAATKIDLPFYCELQTLGMLEELEDDSFEEIQKRHPAVLASARYYWGTLTKGFALLDIEFKGEPQLSWKDKVKGSLGQCSDSLIAEICGVSNSTVSRLRKKLGIPAYRCGT